ncbi:MAG: hydrogenase expression/formation protein HypE [Thermoanaerobaculia bacterium]|nr:hydrogenase expression/formation protein HypE [Thermoanaerobaculia bacterium]
MTDGRVEMRHGGGGRSMRKLIEEVFARGFADVPFDGIGLAAMDDGAAIRVGDRWLVLTTDSHVIHPVFFPGGDIGRLAVAGTCNDLAMMGATEGIALTCAMVIEEGFPLDKLERIQRSMVETCREAGAMIVTGDTKVMGKGELDGIIINTSGIAFAGAPVRDSGLHLGDKLIVTGTMGDHGLAVMAARHNLEIDGGTLVSDVAPLTNMIRAALRAGNGGIVAMKDPTRGGLASSLGEMATKANVGIVIHERDIPVSAAARAAGELIGIDPLQVANEGKAVIGVRAEVVDAVLAALREHPLGRDAAIVGEAVAERPGSVILDTGYGRRLLVESDGEPLPRIC